MTPRTVLALTALALALPHAAPAQAASTSWVLDDARGGFCIWYLTDPELAPKLLPKGVEGRGVRDADPLPPMLRRVVQDEPRFQEWIPSMLCLGRYGAVQADGRQLDRARDAERPVVVTWQGMGAEAPHGVREAPWVLTALGGDAAQLGRAAGNALVNFQSREIRNNRARDDESGNDDWEIRVDGVKLFWNGRQTGEPRVGTTQVMSFGYAGARTTEWGVELETAPGSERPVIGTLRIEGKNELAEALKRSPVRAVGVASLGGRATVTFRRAGSR